MPCGTCSWAWRHTPGTWRPDVLAQKTRRCICAGFFYAYRTNMSLAQAGPIAPPFGELSSVCQAVHRDDAELRLADLLDAVEGDVSQPELAVAQADGLTDPCSKESCGRRSDYEVRASAHILPIIHTNQRFSLNSMNAGKTQYFCSHKYHNDWWNSHQDELQDKRLIAYLLCAYHLGAEKVFSCVITSCFDFFCCSSATE